MKQGITLIEILLVVLLIIFLALFFFPIGISFYKSQQLESHTQGILQTLRRAQLKAIGMESDSSFGIYFDDSNKKYILFKGNSYSPGDPSNEEFEFPASITISGFSVVFFSKAEGKPSVTGNIIVSTNGLTQTININEVGRINLE